VQGEYAMSRDLDAGAIIGATTTRSPIKRWIMLFLSLLFITGMSSLATASGTIFAIEKKFCTGNPALISQPENCTTATQANIGDDVYYEITVTNPWGQPPQTIDLTDQFPTGFVPTTGGLFCKDDTGASVSFSPSTSSNGVAQVSLGIMQTIHCFIPGKYTGPGKKTNEAVGKSDSNVTMKSEVKTEIFTPSPLNADLVIDKTASPSALNVTTSPGFLTYTITITNNGPADVDIGDWFQLHDNLSMPAGGTPLGVEYVSANCVSTAQTDCLKASGPVMAGTNPYVTSESGPTHFFDWGFDKNNGHIAAHGVITLTITVRISQLSGLNCVRTQQTNGVNNTAFFTLTNPNGTAVADNIASNNTDTVFTPVTTGQKVDPDCATGQLTIKKEMVRPTNPVEWGDTVGYTITIENKSTPKQVITIKNADLEDWLTEGVNTPPFTATHVQTTCLYYAAGKAGVPCNKFGVKDKTPLQFTYYDHSQSAWNSTNDITINPGDKVVIYTEFIYDSADCETVPNGQKPIRNTAKLKYEATLFGQPKTKKTYEQSSTATTLMQNLEPCDFRVTKTANPRAMISDQIQFNVPFQYTVTYSNNGIGRTIGTIMDAVRINKGNYATSLPFSTNWTCTEVGGVKGATMTGAVTTGSAIFTQSPAQGSPAVILGSNVFFPSHSVLTCTVNITVKRPPFNDPFCTTDDVRFENLALMDVTNPFNNNISWPPSSTYVPFAKSNPPIQKFNWATVALKLPKCWDAHVNKKATVGGLPTNSAPWTYAGNPNPVNYTITTTNDADSPLGTPNSATPGWTVTDTFASPYSNGQASFVSCLAAGWCWNTGSYAPGNAQIGIKNIAPSDSGNWNLTLPGSAVVMGQNINNCAKLQALGVNAGSSWYYNDDPTLTPDPLKSCAEVPVIETTKISVRKQVVDLTGAGVKSLGAFGFSVACSPYAIPTAATSTFTLSTDNTGYSNYQAVTPVAKYGTCTVTETSMPVIPAAMATACKGVANVIVTSSAPVTLTNLLANDNPVTVTNTYSCKSLGGQLEVIKSLTTPMLPVQWPATTWTINTNCTPAGSASSVTINTAASGNAVITGSDSVTAPIGATCTVEEPSASMPAFSNWLNNASSTGYCATHGGGLPVWDAPTYTYNGQTTTTPPTVGITVGLQSVTVNNAWHCGIAPPQIEIKKRIIGLPNWVPDFPSVTATINTDCAPFASAATLQLTTPVTAAGLFNTVPVSGVVTAPLGANCIISETPPPLPQYAFNFCNTRGQTPEWKLPVITPSATFTVGATNPATMVTNEWKCVGSSSGSGSTAPGKVKIYKLVSGPSGAPITILQDYVFDTNCAVPATPPSVTITTIKDSVAAEFVAQVNTTCTIEETFPATWQPDIELFCKNQTPAGETVDYKPVWEMPTYSTAQPMVVGTTNPTVIVSNKWHCEQGPLRKKAPMKKPRFKINIGIGIPILGGGGRKDEPSQPRDIPGKI
jgi:uncharacterized repeat protein (TIGR01451 family)